MWMQAVSQDQKAANPCITMNNCGHLQIPRHTLNITRSTGTEFMEFEYHCNAQHHFTKV